MKNENKIIATLILVILPCVQRSGLGDVGILKNVCPELKLNL